MTSVSVLPSYTWANRSFDATLSEERHHFFFKFSPSQSSKHHPAVLMQHRDNPSSCCSISMKCSYLYSPYFKLKGQGWLQIRHSGIPRTQSCSRFCLRVCYVSCQHICAYFARIYFCLLHSSYLSDLIGLYVCLCLWLYSNSIYSLALFLSLCWFFSFVSLSTFPLIRYINRKWSTKWAVISDPYGQPYVRGPLKPSSTDQR